MVTLMMPFPKKSYFWNFGYLPRKNPVKDLVFWMVGFPNLLKRLQAKEIMNVLDLSSEDVVLDLGCGHGHFTVEIAKNVNKCIGIDIWEGVKDIIPPTELKGRLEFQQGNVEALPFEDAVFDKILASEVLAIFPDLDKAFVEIKRVLKPDGHLILVNGVGHPELKNAYARKSRKLIKLKEKFPDSFPDSYEKYVEDINKIFGNLKSRFFSEKEITDLLASYGMRIQQKRFAPGKKVYSSFSWTQFTSYLSTGNPLSVKRSFILFPWLYLQDYSDPERISGGLILDAMKDG